MKDETASRVTPHLKRHGSAKKLPQAKRHRRKSPASKEPAATTTCAAPMQWEEQVNRLDPNDPVQANRIQQRRKMILKGKNTVGYDRYLQQVPKHKRIPRSMATPATPDPTVDISTKRWQGQVRAWRVALHKYDPPELLNTSVAPSSSANSADYQTPRKSTVSPNSNEDSPLTIMSGTSCRDLDAEFAAASPRPFLITGASGWGDDSSDDDDDDLL